jgi:hypothetical protein
MRIRSFITLLLLFFPMALLSATGTQALTITTTVEGDGKIFPPGPAVTVAEGGSVTFIAQALTGATFTGLYVGTATDPLEECDEEGNCWLSTRTHLHRRRGR